MRCPIASTLRFDAAIPNPYALLTGPFEKRAKIANMIGRDQFLKRGAYSRCSCQTVLRSVASYDANT